LAKEVVSFQLGTFQLVVNSASSFVD